MNVSGPWVARAWREALDTQGVGPEDLALVLVHDDLEEDLGVVKIRKWERSHRGHNGVKSVGASLRPADYAGRKWARVSVGIGRPDGRDRSTVSDYVLREVSETERKVIDEKAALGVLEALLELERKWEKDTGRIPAKEDSR